MGLLFVLMLWGLFGCVVAIVGALVLRAIATALVGKVHNNPNGSARQRVIQFAMLLPFACLVWVGIIFVFQGFINSEFLHRDVGLGDEMYCPLPNGYSLSMIDDGEEGTVSSTKAQSSDESSSYQADGMSGVRGCRLFVPTFSAQLTVSMWSILLKTTQARIVISQSTLEPGVVQIFRTRTSYESRLRAWE